MSLLTSLANASLVGGAASGVGRPILSASRPIVEEGDEVQFILYVPDGVEGTTYAYSITGITANDLFYGTLTGNFTLDSLQGAQVSITLARDSVQEIETITMTVSSLNLSVQVTITDTSPAPVGESIYDYPGGYTWVCPAGVTSVSVVAIGGGGNGGYIRTSDGSSRAGGGGGGLGWKNNIAVTPGTSYTVVVSGWYGQNSTSSRTSFISYTVVSGELGDSGYSSYIGKAGGSYIGDGGGYGGSSATMSSSTTSTRLGGGGGGGGYLNTGGAGGASNSAGTGSNTGGGGGGSGYYFRNGSSGSGGFGGGTGLFGTGGGSATSGGSSSQYAGGGGMYNPVTYPTTGNWVNNNDGYGRAAQRFGGGGGAITSDNLISNYGGPGGLRIIWGGGRSFPNNAGYLAPSNGGTSVTLQQTLNNPNAYSTSASDFFGVSVAIDGNYAIVGASEEDGPSVGSSIGSGKAYIFNVTTGALVHTLDNPNPYGTSEEDTFGYSVAISGNYCIVGAHGEDDAGGNSSGKAYIFDVTTGSLVHTLDNPNPDGDSGLDSFSLPVAMSGNYAIFGATWEGGVQAGAAYIFNVTTGALVHILDNPNAYGTSQNDLFSSAVAISSNYAIVGARWEDDAGGNYSGKAYIFDVLTGDLVHTLDNPNAYADAWNDEFGRAVAISGNYAIVGAAGERDAGGDVSGKAYIFDVTTGSLVHTLDNPNAYSTSANDRFGYKLAISGNYAIVGAYYEDDASGTNSGKAYIFDVTTGTLLKTLDNPNPYGTSTDDFFALSLEISGNYIIVGAYREGDAGGTLSGKAYIYRLDQT